LIAISSSVDATNATPVTANAQFGPITAMSKPAPAGPTMRITFQMPLV
jgi:hypothetical protein